MGRPPEAWDHRCKICGNNGPFYKGDRVCKSCRYTRAMTRLASDTEARDAQKRRDAASAMRGHHRRRMAALAAYGGACACCDERAVPFLAIDHIGGGGNAHRRSLGKDGKMISTTAFFRWLADNGFPDGFRVLCHNCNFALGHYGRCPHDNPGIS